MYSFDKEKHLHTLDGKSLTGTSSVIDVLAKPLTWWASGKAVEVLGWSNPKLVSKEERPKLAEVVLGQIKGMDSETYLTLLDKAYRAHNDTKNKAAKKGTDLHAELETYVKWKMGLIKLEHLGDALPEQIHPFIHWADENVKEFIWSEAHCYSERLWVGGVSDVGAILNDGTFAIIDFKSSKEAYIGQFIQIAGYAIEVEENGLFDATGKHTKKIDGKIGALIVVPFGAEKVLPVIMRDVEQYKKGFESAVQLYRLMFNNKEN